MKTVTGIAIAALLGLPLGVLAQQAPTPDKAAAQGEKRQGEQRQIEITVPGAKSEQEAREVLSADALLARCVIKPVMTDAEIELCQRAYRLTRQANAGRR